MHVQAYAGPGPKITFGFIGATQKHIDKFYRKLSKKLKGVDGDFRDKDIDGSRELRLGRNEPMTIEEVTDIARKVAYKRNWTFQLFDETRFYGEDR